MLLYILYSLARIGAGVVPRALSVWIARRIADVFFICDGKARRAVIANLTHILSFQGVDTSNSRVRRRIHWLARETFENFAIHVVDFLRIDQTMTDVRLGLIEIENFHRFEEALARGRGVISATAHIGNWEVGAAVTYSMGHPVYSVAQKQKNRWMDRFFAKLRKSGGMRILPPGRAARGIFGALKENQIVGIVADRDIDGSGVPVSFFGGTIKIPRGPAEIAARSGAAVVPAFLVQTEKGLSKLIVERPIEVDERAPVARRIEQINDGIVRVLERYILRYPTQWFAFYKVWDGDE